MRNKIISIIVIMILVVCLVAQIVNAASLTVTMKPSSSSVKAATEFTVKVSVSNLDVGSNGINALSGYLEYDKDIFEDIDESNIEGSNKWSASYDKTTGKVELKKSTFVKTTQEVFQIVLKTKSGVSGKSGSISFSDIKASNSEEDIPASDISVSISVTEGDGTSDDDENVSVSEPTNTKVSIVANTNKDNNTSNSNSTNTSSNTANNTSNNNSSNTSNNTSTNNSSSVSNNSSNSTSNYTNTTSEDDMPKTGVNDTIISMMLVLIVIALVFYIKFEKINKDYK